MQCESICYRPPFSIKWSHHIIVPCRCIDNSFTGDCPCLLQHECHAMYCLQHECHVVPERSCERFSHMGKTKNVLTSTSPRASNCNQAWAASGLWRSRWGRPLLMTRRYHENAWLLIVAAAESWSRYVLTTARHGCNTKQIVQTPDSNYSCSKVLPSHIASVWCKA